ncbi:hypothetical protein C7M61_003207 [Candidozyma pseudohaemuli]|uniref:Uncharacterized protein n=1 Tax=Candidozyma pseudohaemuli TaxID=418784 RepID=A0A2P7YPQ7_9ASCO|nr:hypothetical protein C7M61_003207 [[Candida] pseudohaemulonii]PSK37956.1 hypothetical protein C7M61_003207 [[Candida] pseudohaemulonii]
MSTTPKDRERNSPMSSSEGLSGSLSPRLVRPAAPPVKKQRSSSMNSVGSNHSSHQRSMSIISLELPRNLIISVDDNFLKPSRNDSTASLSSMGVALPNEPAKDNYIITHRHKLRHKNNTSAIMLDEDSELEIQIGKARWRRNSSEKRVSSLLSVKKDYKFKFDKKKSKSHLATSNPQPSVSFTHPPAAPVLEDPVSLPLSVHEASFPSLTNVLHHQHHQNQHLHSSQHQNTNQSPPPPPPPHLPSTLWAQSSQKSQSPGSISPDDTESLGQLRTPSKKVRSSSITQSMFLKRRMLLLKDLQLELLELNSSPNSSPNIMSSDTKFPTPALPQPHRPGLSIIDDNVSPSQTFNPLRALRSPSPPPQCFFSEETSTRQQNKLITELNRKWNKAVFDSSEKRPEIKDPLMAAPAPSRKRDRSELVSSSDSHAIY